MLYEFSPEELHQAGLSIDSPIEDHVQYLTDKILKKPYGTPNKRRNTTGKIAREIHGGAHAAETAALGTV